jgi:hypothetical protein
MRQWVKQEGIMWFSIDVLFVRKHTDSSLGALLEECIYIIQASDEDTALRKGELLAHQQKCCFKVDDLNESNWEFDSIINVHEILDSELKDGSEIFSRFLTGEEARLLKNRIKL